MKINISTIKNENALSEIRSSAANKIIGGENTATVDCNSQTTGETSRPDLIVEKFYVHPGETDI